jgi:hypothetical protein
MLRTGAAIAMTAMALPGAGRASDGTISFIGGVTTPSCTGIVGGACDRAVDTAKMGAPSVVSIYFETVDSAEPESVGIIDIVYK